ncbi:MAG: CPBP family intramembrane metalloprotease [Pirellulaceae bacterium]|nr:CPBP family intramembrane metalloprotease [Pirellulaceae bacterium]
MYDDHFYPQHFWRNGMMSGDLTDPLESSTSTDRGDLPRVWTVFTAVLVSLLIATVLQVILTIVLVAIELANGVTPEQLGPKLTERLTEPPFFLSMLVLGQLGFGLTALLCVWKSPTPWRERISWSTPKPSRSIYWLAAIGTIFPTVVGLTAAVAASDFLPADASFESLFSKLTIPTAIAFVILIGVLPGLFEEVLFRGYMQQRLVQRWGAVTGITVTSIVFALVHIMPLNIIAVIPIGFWLGYIAWRSQSILPTIAAHFFINSGINLWRMIVKFGEIPTAVQWWVHGGFAVVGFVCFVICFRSSYWSPP